MSFELWRTHSCVPRRDSSRRKDADLRHSVHTSVNAARTSACATAVQEASSKRGAILPHSRNIFPDGRMGL